MEILRRQICFFFVWLAQRWFDTSRSNQAFDQHFDLDPLVARPFLSPAEPLVASMPPFAVLPTLAVDATQLATVGSIAVVVAPLPFAIGSWPAAIVSGAPVASVTLRALAIFPSLALALLLPQPPLPVQPTAIGRAPPAFVAQWLVVTSAPLLTCWLPPLFSSSPPFPLFAFVIVRFSQSKPLLHLLELILLGAQEAFALSLF